jgi:hypothetical protein
MLGVQQLSNAEHTKIMQVLYTHHCGEAFKATLNKYVNIFLPLA